jgi:hypothetical protein
MKTFMLDAPETLRRYAVTLKRLCSPSYPLAVAIAFDTDDPSRVDAQDGMPLRQCGLVVDDNDYWEGSVLATVLLRDLKLDDDYVWSLSPLLQDRGCPLVDLWGEALLKSHIGVFENFSTFITPSVWERGCTNSIHRHYGLDLLPEEGDKPPRLRFRFHASAIVSAVNEQLQLETEEGSVE